MTTKTERAQQANKFLASVAGCGRKFFAYKERVSRFEVDARGRIWANGQALDRDMFYLFAMPLKIKGIDSSGCRLFAVVER